jgi:hypothetical protein
VGKQWGTIGKMVRHQWAIAEWDNRGATMGKLWESSRKMVDNSGKMGRKQWKNCGGTNGTIDGTSGKVAQHQWGNSRVPMGKWWVNSGKILQQHWKNSGAPMGKW